jgi:hypothetical protein
MRYVVKKVLPGGAAGLSCQIHPGDIIVDIDNHPTTGVPEHRIAQWVLGEAGALRTKISNFRSFTYYFVLKYLTRSGIWARQVLKYLTLGTKICNFRD